MHSITLGEAQKEKLYKVNPKLFGSINGSNDACAVCEVKKPLYPSKFLNHIQARTHTYMCIYIYVNYIYSIHK